MHPVSYFLQSTLFPSDISKAWNAPNMDFKVIDSEVKMNFHPRHGTIIPITRAELKRITDKWPSKEMGNMACRRVAQAVNIQVRRQIVRFEDFFEPPCEC